MPFLYGILGGLMVFLLLALGMALGLLLGKYLRPRDGAKRNISAEEAFRQEEERKRLVESQQAFRMLQDYSAERAYGMMDSGLPKSGGNGGA